MYVSSPAAFSTLLKTVTNFFSRNTFTVFDCKRKRSSAFRENNFVSEAISELSVCGRMKEVADYPKFCNPLPVLVFSPGKLRLILGVPHLKKITIKKSVKYEDLETIRGSNVLFGTFVVSFGSKSAYCYVDIFEERMVLVRRSDEILRV